MEEKRGWGRAQKGGRNFSAEIEPLAQPCPKDKQRNTDIKDVFVINTPKMCIITNITNLVYWKENSSDIREVIQ